MCLGVRVYLLAKGMEAGYVVSFVTVCVVAHCFHPDNELKDFKNVQDYGPALTMSWFLLQVPLLNTGVLISTCVTYLLLLEAIPIGRKYIMLFEAIKLISSKLDWNFTKTQIIF